MALVPFEVLEGQIDQVKEIAGRIALAMVRHALAAAQGTG